MGVGVIPKFHTHSEAGVQEVRGLRVEQSAVAKNSRAGTAVGVFFVKGRINGKDTFQGTRGGVVEREGYKLSLGRYMGNIHVLGVPKFLVGHGRRGERFRD